ncbi:MAG: glycosyltransferase [Syntrophorhabdaceae bacterium]|nr:glycosyltransferase [Syntrophorhabdaceae bacterium]
MDKVTINLVYAHLRPDFISSVSRGNVCVINTRKPVIGCAVYVYMDAFSFYGRQPGLNVLFITEPTIVLPGQYNDVIWKQFDRVVTLCDELVEKYGFTKGYSPHQGFHPWFGDSKDFIITEDLDERVRKYPLHERKPGICMVSGNKHSLVPGELYSKRLEAAVWFHFNSDTPFDVYGMVPFFLPNYKGAIENNRKLDLLSSYKYSLSFENTADPVFARGWVDKLIDSLEARTLPIYLGCPNIDEYIPRTCFIDFRDFKDYEELSKYLRTMPESEYIRYIDSIDTWIHSGGLRPYSWYPLYDNLVKYYCEQTGVDSASLFGNDTEWQAASMTRAVDFVDSPSLWTYEELATTPSPLLNYQDNSADKGSANDKESIRQAITLVREGAYDRAAKAMAWLHFYPNADLLCFYAQVLHMLGYYDTEKVYLTLALQLDPHHIPARRQLLSASFGKEDLDKAVLRFESMMAREISGAKTIPGLTSVIIPVSVSSLDGARRCLESIRAQVKEPHEVIIVKPGALKTPPWLHRHVSDDPQCRTIDVGESANYAVACNDAIQESTGQYVLVLDANTLMLKGTLTRMLDCLNRSPDHGMIVPVSNRAVGIQQLSAPDNLSLKDFEEYAANYSERNANHCVTTFDADYACILTKRSSFDEIGYFNEDMETPYSVINDLRMRILVEGQRCVIAADSCIYVNQHGPREKRVDRAFRALWGRLDPNSEKARKLSPFIAMRNARDRYSKGLLNEAVQAIMNGIRRTPDNGNLYYCLAEILLDAKSYQEAAAAMDSLPENEKDSPRALEILARCDYHLDHIEDARDHADRALSLCGDSAKAFNLKGLLAMRSGDQKESKLFFKKAIAADPSFADPYMNLGVMKWHDGRAEEGFELIEKAFVLEPERSDFAATYDSAVGSLDRLQRAEQAVREAHSFFPHNKQLAFLLVAILLKQKKDKDAMEEIEKALTTFGIDDGILNAALDVRKKVGPLRIAGDEQKNTLSVCMITKNEEKYIARCLASLTPVADEIIVVDTGSTDRTKQIAQVFGAQVYDHPWNDDFAEARNASLERATGRWVLVHDGDEVISPRDHQRLRHTISRKVRKRVAYTMATRNYTNNANLEGWIENIGEYPDEEEGTGWVSTGKVRLFTNHKSIRFQNSVHELLEFSLARLNVHPEHYEVPVHHYGKLDAERLSMRAEMYYHMGKKKLETMQDSRALRELAVQAAELRKYEEAIGLWQLYIKFKPDECSIYVNLATCYLELGMFDKALEMAKRSMDLDPASKDAMLGYGAASLCNGNVTEAVSVLERLRDAQPGYYPAIGVLAAAYCVGNDPLKGETLLKDMWSKRVHYGKALHSLAQKLISAGGILYAQRLLTRMVATGHTEPDSRQLLDELTDTRKFGKASP